jgi:tetratricopeptide (TPR) repeat protein
MRGPDAPRLPGTGACRIMSAQATARNSCAVSTLPRFASVLAVACLLPVAGCTTLRPDAAASAPPAAPPEQAVEIVGEAPVEPLQSAEARVQYHVMAGELAAARQQPGLAAREFLAALEYIADADLARRTAMMAVAARDEDLSLAAARRWLQIEPDSAEPRELITTLSLQQGELLAALEQAAELIRRHPAGPADGFLHVAQIIVQIGEERADGALTVMQQLVAEWPDLAGAHHALGVAALNLKRIDLAEAAARRARELDPGQRDYELLQVGIWIQQGRVEEADARMTKLVATEPKSTELRMGYARLLLDNGERDAARRQLEAVLAIDPLHQDALFALGVLAFNDGRHADAETHLRKILSGPRAQDAALQLGRIAEIQQRHEDALRYYGRVRHGPSAIEAVMRSANVLSRTGRIDNARRLMDELRDRFPQLAIRFDIAEGEMLIASGDAKAALQMYDEALAEEPGNHDLLYGRSLAYERLSRVDDAERDLRNILEQAPDDARALNALGYMLTVHTDRLAEAEPMIARALELQPDDAAIMDSMGWLHFKRGRPEKALELLRAAHERFPDPEVAAHLGEVLWTLGRHDEARAVWAAALRNDPQHPVLLETTQRLNP